MKYNHLGRSGLKVSELSLGSWITFGNNLDSSGVKECMRTAFDRGVNFFDNAEAYSRGESEILMGEAIREFRREDLVIATKLYWGGNGPNDTGLSWKHLVEGVRNSLRRLKLQYVDVLYCHRPDENTPLEETVRAMDYIIKTGYAFYWGTSEWPAGLIEEAFKIAEQCNCIAPVTEQTQYNMFARDRMETEYAPLYESRGLGNTTWSPLASGILAGKYNDGIPSGSRLERNEWLQKELTEEKIEKVKQLSQLAEELDCSLAQLSIAWCLKNPRVSTVITGASTVDQIIENLKAADIRDKLDAELLKRIDTILAH